MSIRKIQIRDDNKRKLVIEAVNTLKWYDGCYKGGDWDLMRALDQAYGKMQGIERTGLLFGIDIYDYITEIWEEWRCYMMWNKDFEYPEITEII